jgi:hypothetical protein
MLKILPLHTIKLPGEGKKELIVSLNAPDKEYHI